MVSKQDMPVLGFVWQFMHWDSKGSFVYGETSVNTSSIICDALWISSTVSKHWPLQLEFLSVEEEEVHKLRTSRSQSARGYFGSKDPGSWPSASSDAVLPSRAGPRTVPPTSEHMSWTSRGEASAPVYSQRTVCKKSLKDKFMVQNPTNFSENDEHICILIVLLTFFGLGVRRFFHYKDCYSKTTDLQHLCFSHGWINLWNLLTVHSYKDTTLYSHFTHWTSKENNCQTYDGVIRPRPRFSLC